MTDTSRLVTVVTVNLGLKDAFSLMWESFTKHNGQHPLFVADNGSKDGCAELGREWADRFIELPNVHHGVALDTLCKLVETPWTLVVDNDVEFLAPVLEDMINLGWDDFCVCPPKRYDMGTARIEDGMGGWVDAAGQDRIDPCCALFQTGALQELLQWVSFTCYRSPLQGKHYDTGSMLYHVARAAGLRIETPEWIWQRVTHFGTLTWGMSAPEGSPDRVTAEERYAEVKQRLAALREEG